MGTIYYLADVAGKHALCIDKCRWLGWTSPCTAADILQAAAEALGRQSDPWVGEPERWWPQPSTLIRWLTDVAEGRPCRMMTPEHDDDPPPWRREEGWTLDEVEGPDGWRREGDPFVDFGETAWPAPVSRVPRYVECPRTAGGVEGFDPLPPDDDALRMWTATEWRVLVGRP